jgi:cell wall-associated NlpC family hydrolase
MSVFLVTRFIYPVNRPINWATTQGLSMNGKNRFIFFLILVIFIGCAAQPRYTSQPVERKKYHPPEETRETNIDQTKMSQIIDSFLGTPYKEGGSNKWGMDCSGFVMEVYRQYAGFKLPHSSEKLFKLVKKVDKEKLGYGDLVFFTEDRFSPSHVGIYIGEGKFVHSTKRYGVIVTSLDEEYYRKTYIGARRVIP